VQLSYAAADDIAAAYPVEHSTSMSKRCRPRGRATQCRLGIPGANRETTKAIYDASRPSRRVRRGKRRTERARKATLAALAKGNAATRTSPRLSTA